MPWLEKLLMLRLSRLFNNLSDLFICQIFKVRFEMFDTLVVFSFYDFHSCICEICFKMKLFSPSRSGNQSDLNDFYAL